MPIADNGYRRPDPAADPFATPGFQPPVSWQERVRRSSALIPAIALLLLALLGLAGTLVARQIDRQPGGAFGAATPAQPVLSPQQQAAAANPVANTPVQPAPVRRAPVIVQAPAPAPVVVCATCGTVESVVAVQRTGSGSGLGAVAGGVVGGLLGNQVGGGSGKTAATIVGAVGGGFAGNAIEKNVNKTTVYQVRVRMEDGSVRTLEQARAPAQGSRVFVEGSTLRPAA